MRREETDEGNGLLLPFLERKESALGLSSAADAIIYSFQSPKAAILLTREGYQKQGVSLGAG